MVIELQPGHFTFCESMCVQSYFYDTYVTLCQNNGNCARFWAELRIVIGVVVMLQPGHLMVYSIWNEEQAERENSRLVSMERRKFQLSE